MDQLVRWLNVLERGDWDVRQTACRALAALGPEAAPSLIERLAHPSHEVRWLAGRVLEQLGEGRLARAVVDALKGTESGPMSLRNLIADGDLRAVPLLMRRLADSSPESRTARDAAYRALSSIAGPPIAPFLIESLERPKADGQQTMICRILGKAKDPRAIKPLLRQMHSYDWGTREAASQALVAIAFASPTPQGADEERNEARQPENGSPLNIRQEIVLPLIAMLPNASAAVRQSACEALGQLEDREAVLPLIARLEDGQPEVCRTAAGALEMLGDLRAVGPLFARLEDADEGVLQAVKSALDALTMPLEPYLQTGLCGECFSRLERTALERSFLSDSLSAVACRKCRRADAVLYDISYVVAVLNERMEKTFSAVNEIVSVNWLRHRQLFDFDEVYIIRASDEEVERFCVQVGNDTNPYRQGLYRKMRCVLPPSGSLSGNTVRILRSLFGEVETATD
ncbi:MAG: HEAT repeat domain-containing protein [Armatimonadetes bacterium]|nr:HEAT repeat domain-containing protein [Armatimonadota bacterium]